jgi:hypothetical protein
MFRVRASPGGARTGDAATPPPSSVPPPASGLPFVQGERFRPASEDARAAGCGEGFAPEDVPVSRAFAPARPGAILRVSGSKPWPNIESSAGDRHESAYGLPCSEAAGKTRFASGIRRPPSQFHFAQARRGPPRPGQQLSPAPDSGGGMRTHVLSPLTRRFAPPSPARGEGIAFSPCGRRWPRAAGADEGAPALASPGQNR